MQRIRSRTLLFDLDMSNPYKDYFEATLLRDDEWAGVDADKARKRIKRIKEIASWNGCSEEEVIALMDDEMGG